MVRRVHLLLMTLSAALMAGSCVIVPRLPADLDLHHAEFVSEVVQSPRWIDRAGWNSASAVKGGMAGGGIGLAASGLACAATGPMAPLCWGTLVPFSVTVGVVGGAAIGAGAGRNEEGLVEKHALMQSEWPLAVARGMLVGQLQQRAREQWAVEIPLREDEQAAAAALPAWRLKVTQGPLLAEVTQAGKPYGVAVQAHLIVLRLRDGHPLYDAAFAARSAERMTTAQWAADDALALRRTLDVLITDLASQIAADLSRGAH